jgi:hypothetical protein
MDTIWQISSFSYPYQSVQHVFHHVVIFGNYFYDQPPAWRHSALKLDWVLTTANYGGAHDNKFLVTHPNFAMLLNFRNRQAQRSWSHRASHVPWCLWCTLNGCHFHGNYSNKGTFTKSCQPTLGFSPCGRSVWSPPFTAVPGARFHETFPFQSWLHYLGPLQFFLSFWSLLHFHEKAEQDTRRFNLDFKLNVSNK